MNNRKEFSPELIGQLLMEREMTPRQLAEQLGVRPITIHNWLKGKSEPRGLNYELAMKWINGSPLPPADELKRKATFARVVTATRRHEIELAAELLLELHNDGQLWIPLLISAAAEANRKLLPAPPPPQFRRWLDGEISRLSGQ